MTKSFYNKSFVWASTVLALLLTGCRSDRLLSDMPENSIQISAGINDNTRGILGSTDLTSNTKINLYDVTENGGVLTTYINGVTASYGTPNWSITGSPYSWYVNSNLPNHNFFCILNTDKDNLKATSLFGTNQPSLSVSGSKYTFNFPSTEFLLSRTQFDACYSNIVSREKSDANFSTVELTLSHLFTCFGFSATNYNSRAVTIKSVKLYGLTNKKSAKVEYDISDGSTTVTYTADPSAPKSWNTDAKAVELLSSSITLAANESCENVITSFGTGSTSTPEFFLMWPQTTAELTPTNANIGRDNAGNIIKTASDPMLVITYSIGSDDDIVMPVALPHDQDWTAGHCRQMNISFTSKSVELEARTINWNYEESNIDYSGNVSVKSNGQLSFISTSCIIDEYQKMIFFRGGNPITATFALDSPIGDTWMISKNGDFDAFEIDNSDTGTIGDKTDSNFGIIDGNVATFTIMPTISSPLKEYKLTLSFAVRTSTDRVIDITDIVQPVTYTIVLQSIL